MRRQYPNSKRCFSNRGTIERLEERRLLAGDFQAGDANQDYFFDESDLIQVMKVAKYDTGEAASWEEGDWNEDV